ncbi:uncharacterized protein LOC143446860 [Clavelina lepadiformis]|uniref:TATA-box-binding protein n=1 Tax=Clavelina lepadiformis TaxID=159417 RepID=A0ABP0FGZ2_CLALP
MNQSSRQIPGTMSNMGQINPHGSIADSRTISQMSTSLMPTSSVTMHQVGSSLHLPNPSGYSSQPHPIVYKHQVYQQQQQQEKVQENQNQPSSDRPQLQSYRSSNASTSQTQGPPSASVPTPYLSAMTPMTPRTPADLGVGPPQLQNIVSTVNLDTKLDLKKIALHARNAEYNPKRFAAVIMRIREPRTTALIFSSGKMVCTGAKSENQSRLAARKYARVVQKLGFDAKFLDFKIQNMVGSVDVKFPIRLEGLVLTHSQFSSYEPELFPGLIYRMVKPRIVLLIFVSGKVVLTGAKVRHEIDEAFNNIYPILKGFRKTC